MIKDLINKNENIKPNSKEMEILRNNFPSCFHGDGSFDIERFKEYLSDEVDVTHEGYELKFLGKNYAKMIAAQDSTTVIIPDEEHNSLPENKDSENIYISGDNLDALQHLLQSYSEKIKCIYIDPPYNTDSDDFVYNDKFNFTVEELSQKLSIDEDQASRILDLTKRGSASHSAWLMFMYPRLLLARDLLTEDGVIFISIDDNEQSNLKLICDDIFGEENCEGHIHWRRRSNQPNDKTKLIGLVAEHIIVYSRNSQRLKELGVGKISLTGDFSNPDNDPRGPWASKPWKSGSGQSGTRYTITTPKGISLDEEWMGDQETYLSLLADNRIIFPRSGKGMPRKKYFKSEREKEGQCATNWWPHEIYGNNQEASRELEKLFGYKNAFNNPKPTKLLDAIIGLSNVKEGDFILDFFSGSATTAEAAMHYSADRKCKYIMVQLPEDLDVLIQNANTKEKEKWINNIRMLDENNRCHTLDQIGIERIIRAAARIREEHPDMVIDLGFKHYTLREPSEDAIDKIMEFDPNQALVASDILSEFGTDTVLATWMVRDGYGFASAQAIDLNGYTAYYYGKHLYIISPGLSDSAISELVSILDVDGSINPETIAIFGYSLTWTEMNALKTNLSKLKATETNKNINFDIRY